MKILPAIDLYGGQAVRLYKGDYRNMTVYSSDPVGVAREFQAAGATEIHMVDLEGARDGSTPNIDIVRRVVRETVLSVEIGGGIRSMESIEAYVASGVSRVILGTAAVTDQEFLRQAVERYGDRIAVGADIRDGIVAIKGWLVQSPYTLDDFLRMMEAIGVATVICTDISKDGAMGGTNLELYKRLAAEYDLKIIASGGVSTLADVEALASMNIYGAIIGKAYYTGAIDLREAIRAAS